MATVTGGIAPIPAIRSIAAAPTTPAEPHSAIAPVASVEDLAVDVSAESKGSDDFQAALELITDGEEVDAFAAAKDLDERPRAADDRVGRVSTPAATTCPTPRSRPSRPMRRCS